MENNNHFDVEIKDNKKGKTQEMFEIKEESQELDESKNR